MNLIKYLLPLLALPFLSSLSCGKKPPAKPTYYMTQEFKDYVFFPEGSWWVYEDSLSGNIDTIEILSTSIHIVEAEYVSFKPENFVCELSSSFYGAKCLLDGGVGSIDMEVADLKLDKNRQFFHRIFFLPAEVGDQGPQGVSSYRHYYDSLLIKTFVFDSLRLYQSLIIADPTLPVKIYWKKNIGIVKKEMANGVVWELKNYYINN